MLEGENSIILTDSDSGQYGIWVAGSVTIDGEGTLDLSGYRGITSAYSVVNIVDGNLNINTTIYILPMSRSPKPDVGFFLITNIKPIFKPHVTHSSTIKRSSKPSKTPVIHTPN